MSDRHGFDVPQLNGPRVPAGVSLTGHTMRCPDCKRPGAMHGYRGASEIILCRSCKHGFGDEAPSSTVIRRVILGAPPRRISPYHEDTTQAKMLQAIEDACDEFDIQIGELAIAIGYSESGLYSIRSNARKGKLSVGNAQDVIEKLERYAERRRNPKSIQLHTDVRKQAVNAINVALKRTGMSQRKLSAAIGLPEATLTKVLHCSESGDLGRRRSKVVLAKLKDYMEKWHKLIPQLEAFEQQISVRQRLAENIRRQLGMIS